MAMDAAGSIGMVLKAASAAAVAVEAMAGKQVAVRVEAVVRSGKQRSTHTGDAFTAYSTAIISPTAAASLRLSAGGKNDEILIFAYII